MKLQSIFHSLVFRGLVPRPRRRFSWSQALPLGIFLVAFVGACVALEFTGWLLFSNLRPFGLLLLAPWIWWMHLAGYSGLSRPRAVAALLLRLLVLCGFIVLLAEPRAVRKDDRLAVIFVVDHSASIAGEASDAAMEYVLAVAATKPEMDDAGLVFFGRNAAVELPPSMSLPYEAINVEIDREGTDLASSLSLAAALLPPDRRGRIVLISDGVETEGGLAAVLEDLKSKDIPVDVLPVDYHFENEVWLERLEVPRFVKIEETFEVAVILSSLQAGEGELSLQENGRSIFEGKVKFTAGKNRLVIPVYLRGPGYYEYGAKIRLPSGKDGWKHNNQAISYLYLEGRGKVLLVTDPEGDQRDWQPLRDALLHSKREVQVITASAVPRDALALLPHDCIIFVNVPRDQVDEVQLDAIEHAVFHQGTGFLMVGGENSFGPGGYGRSKIEDLLPVTMDISKKKVMPKAALAIVLHTCEFPQGNTWGKRITKQAIKVLSAQDEVGVLVYDYTRGNSWLFPMTPAGQYQKLAVKVNSANIGDMPSFETCMALGLEGLKKSDASTRHMIIISDGDPSAPTPSMIKAYREAKVSVSMVAIFPHGGQDISTMRAVATSTGGRYYFPPSPEALPSIFIKEAKTLRRSAVQNKTFVPEVVYSSAVLKGLGALPEMHGYVLTTPKPRSQVILSGPEEEPDPLLATWRHGVGATAAFTGDLSSNWGADWVKWSQYEAFVKQLITGISRVSTAATLKVRSYAASGQGVILVEDHAKEASFLEVRARVEGPRNHSVALGLRQVAPRRYEARFPLLGEGRYRITAIAVDDGARERREETAHGGFVIPYAQEYMRFRSNPMVLNRIAERTGGRMLRGKETGSDIYDHDRQPKMSSLSIVDWILILLACLIPLDVGLRRVQLDWAMILGWFRRSKQDSEPTLGTLLARKEQVAKTLEGKPDLEPPPKKKTHKLPAKPREEAAAKISNTTTTSRLLEAKRRAREDKKK